MPITGIVGLAAGARLSLWAAPRCALWPGRRPPTSERLGKAVARLAVVGVVVLSLVASDWLASPALAARPCWERVIDDWTDDTSIDGHYTLSCLQAALDQVPEDIRAYSNFEDAVSQARQTAARQLQSKRRTTDPPATQRQSSSASPPTSSPEPAPTVATPVAPAPRRHGLFDDVLTAGARDSRSPPRALIALAAAALLLMSVGVTGLVARRVRARRGPRVP